MSQPTPPPPPMTARDTPSYHVCFEHRGIHVVGIVEGLGRALRVAGLAFMEDEHF